MIKLGILDMDGTLFNTEKLKELGFHTAGITMGYKFDEGLLRQLVGVSESVIRQAITERHPEIDYDNLLFIRKSYEREVMKQSMKSLIKADVPELLAYFEYHNIDGAVATSAPTKKTDYALGLSKLASKFKTVVTADMALPKPAPDIFLTTMERSGSKPCETIIIEDSPTGIKAAIAVEDKIGERLAGIFWVPDTKGPTTKEHFEMLKRCANGATFNRLGEVMIYLDQKFMRSNLVTQFFVNKDDSCAYKVKSFSINTHHFGTTLR